MIEYYDESIFANGFTIRNYSRVHASNDADRYLARRLGKELVDESAACSSRDIVNLNPRLPCAGINLYTMNIYNKSILRHLPYHSIHVTRDSTDRVRVSIYIGEPRPDYDRVLYDVGALDDFATAIMVKYFSVSSPISVTPGLYAIISRYFEDPSRRFYFDETNGGSGLVQLANGEFLHNAEPIQDDSLTLNFSGPPIAL